MSSPRHRSTGLTGAAAAIRERRSVAAMEFALVAPVIATMTLAVFDLARALIVWQQLSDAAEAVAQAAEKLSISVGTGSTATQLTAVQMQDAMTTIYAEIPGLGLGNGVGLYPGQFSVTLSSVTFHPICAAAGGTAGGCQPQQPYVDWSTYLTEGGKSLLQPAAGNAAQALTFLRKCYGSGAGGQAPNSPLLVQTSGSSAGQFLLDNAADQLNYMADPTKASSGATMTVTPQVVADVRYQFTPYITLFMKSVWLYASATEPAPYGGLTQAVSINAPANTYADDGSTNPEQCKTLANP